MYQNIIQSYNVPKAQGSQWIFTLCGDGVQRGQGSPKDPAHELQALSPSPDLPYAETIHRSPLPLAHICIPGLDPTRGPTRVQTTAKLTQHLTYLFPSGSCHLGASCWENPPLSASRVSELMNKWTFYQHCLEDADTVPSFRNTVICHLSFLQNWWGMCLLVTSECSCSTSLGVKRWQLLMLLPSECMIMPAILGGVCRKETSVCACVTHTVTHTQRHTESHRHTYTYTSTRNVIGEV